MEDIVGVESAVQPEEEEKRNNNPFDPLIEIPKTGTSANPFEEFENEESEPLITFDGFSIGLLGYLINLWCKNSIFTN